MAPTISSATRSQLESAKSLSIFAKLSLVPIVLRMVTEAVASTLFTPKSRRAPTRFVHFCLALLRNLTKYTTHPQRHLIFPKDDVSYAEHCKKHNVPLEAEVLPDGTTAYWLGNKNADKILIYFHGGGFSHPTAPGQLAYMWHAKEILSKAGKDVGILNLVYDLAPVARYPRQIQQAAQLLQHVVFTLHKSPANIVLIGDSAGANLVIALLSHIKHGHTAASIPRLDELQQEPIRAAVLISPWVSFKGDFESMKSNASKDIVSYDAGQLWARAYMGTSEPYPNSDNYTQPRDAPAEWWQGLPVQEVRIVSGADETILDGILDWVGKLKQGYGAERVVNEVLEDECHESHMVLPDFGIEEYITMGDVTDKWLMELF